MTLHSAPRLSLLVQAPGPGCLYLLEDLRSGRQRSFAAADELLAELAAVIGADEVAAAQSSDPNENEGGSK